MALSVFISIINLIFFYRSNYDRPHSNQKLSVALTGQHIEVRFEFIR